MKPKLSHAVFICDILSGVCVTPVMFITYTLYLPLCLQSQVAWHLLQRWSSFRSNGWQNTPFSSYLIPGLILTIVVGGSALVATVTMLTGHSIGVIVSLVAGFMMVGWIIGEVAMLGNSSWLHPFYFAIGLVTIGLAVWLWVTEFQHTS